jgi:hypothetical protein
MNGSGVDRVVVIQARLRFLGAYHAFIIVVALDP